MGGTESQIYYLAGKIDHDSDYIPPIVIKRENATIDGFIQYAQDIDPLFDGAKLREGIDTYFDSLDKLFSGGGMISHSGELITDPNTISTLQTQIEENNLPYQTLFMDAGSPKGQKYHIYYVQPNFLERLSYIDGINGRIGTFKLDGQAFHKEDVLREALSIYLSGLNAACNVQFISGHSMLKLYLLSKVRSDKTDK